MGVPLILDTDIGTDMDDALALAYALRHPKIDLHAVTTVSGDTRLRARLARKLLDLAGAPEVEVAAGLATPTGPGRRDPWAGHEGEGVLEPGEELPLSERDAVEVLVADAPGRTVATIGMPTNVAAAFAREPALPRRVRRLAVMGGIFSLTRSDSITFWPSTDHNLNVHPEASVAALNAGAPALYVPLDVTARTYVTREHQEALRGGDDLCAAIARLIDVWAPFMHRIVGDGRIPAHVVGALHDPLTVACLVDKRFVTIERLPVTVVEVDGIARTFVDPVCGHHADVVRSVDADGFVRHLVDLLLAGGR
jgi:purine nucleosidase